MQLVAPMLTGESGSQTASNQTELNDLLPFTENAAEDCKHEEGPAREGRRGVHHAAPADLLPAALRPPGQAELAPGPARAFQKCPCSHSALSRWSSTLTGTRLRSSWSSTARPVPAGPCWAPAGPKRPEVLQGYDPLSSNRLSYYSCRSTCWTN